MTMTTVQTGNGKPRPVSASGANKPVRRKVRGMRKPKRKPMTAGEWAALVAFYS